MQHLIHNDTIISRLKEEIRDEVNNAQRKLYHDLEETFPEIIQAVQHKRGGYYLINKMMHFVDEKTEHGQIDLKEAKFFTHWLNKENRNLRLNKLHLKFTHGELDFQTHCELSKVFSPEQVDELCRTFKERTFNAEDIIIKKGDVIKNLIYISKGVVHEKNGERSDSDAPKLKNRAGDILGLQFVTKNEGESFTT